MPPEHRVCQIMLYYLILNAKILLLFSNNMIYLNACIIWHKRKSIILILIYAIIKNLNPN